MKVCIMPPSCTACKGMLRGVKLTKKIWFSSNVLKFDNHRSDSCCLVADVLNGLRRELILMNYTLRYDAKRFIEVDLRIEKRERERSNQNQNMP